ncbi:MAG: hypothetical protein NZM04_01760 [Methylacidiphilales bacterium]|nr:hypothetical protein [Candidatus Methylacidiphilales bacterium]
MHKAYIKLPKSIITQSRLAPCLLLIGLINLNAHLLGDFYLDSSLPDLKLPAPAEYTKQASDKTEDCLTAPTTAACSNIETIEAQDLSGLNRAIEKAREITLDKQTKVKLTIPIINPEGLQNDWNQIRLAVDKVFDLREMGFGWLFGENRDKAKRIHFDEVFDPALLERAGLSQWISELLQQGGLGPNDCGIAAVQAILLAATHSGNLLISDHVTLALLADGAAFKAWMIQNGFANKDGTMTLAQMESALSAFNLGNRNTSLDADSLIRQVMFEGKGVIANLKLGPGKYHSVLVSGVDIDANGNAHVLFLDPTRHGQGILREPIDHFLSRASDAITLDTPVWQPTDYSDPSLVTLNAIQKRNEAIARWTQDFALGAKKTADVILGLLPVVGQLDSAVTLLTGQTLAGTEVGGAERGLAMGSIIPAGKLIGGIAGDILSAVKPTTATVLNITDDATKVGSAARAPVVIGENMNRVNSYAVRIGGETIDGWLAGRKWTPQLNDEFISAIKAEGRLFVDIGPDFGRRLQNRIDPNLGRPQSLIYGRERQQLLDYWNYQKLYERTGKYQGGVLGFDP